MAKKSREHGSTLIEVVVVAAVLALVSMAFLGTFSALSRFHRKDMFAIKGELLAEEGIEAIRLIKSDSWNTLASIPPGAERFLSLSPFSWSVTTTPEVVDGVFYRSIRVFGVSRDTNDDIVSSGGTTDPDTLRLRSSVSWKEHGATSTASYESYMTNI